MRKLFFILWIFTLVVETISLQARLAIFGGMGWLTTIKFTTLPEKVGFIAVLALFCAAFCGVWAWAFCGVARRLKCDVAKAQRLCATLWVIVVATDLVVRHKVGAILGSAFSFFDFATGVGGVVRMIEQAFQWYGDVIVMSIVAIAALAVACAFLFRWVFKPAASSAFEKIPAPLVKGGIVVAMCLCFAFMSIWAAAFPSTHKVLADETMFGAATHAVVVQATDLDGDGYGAFDLPPDSAPFDGDIHPHALDAPDDSIDQDGLLGDLRRDDLPASTRNRIESMGQANDMSYLARKNVILVVMESVRHDMLDAKIDGKPVMPRLNAFIDDGAMRIDNAFATRGFTQNSITQAFWGSYFDPGHGLVDDFKALGYYTAAYSGEDLLDEGFDESLGWNRAGDRIVDPRSIAANIHHHTTVPASVLLDEVESFLDSYDAQNPLFLYVFFQDPHFPYQQDNPSVLVDRPIKRSEIDVKRRPRLWRTYANQVHHLDAAAGRLIDALKKAKLYDDAIILFISDHGESLFDDGYLLGHGIAIGDLMTHCVMAVRGLETPPPPILSHVDLRPMIWNSFKSRAKSLQNANSLQNAITAPNAINTQIGDHLINGDSPQNAITEQNDDPIINANSLQNAQSPQNAFPVIQFIGATTVPTEISLRYADGRRITYEFATRKAWRIHPYASFDAETVVQRIAYNGEPADAKIDPATALRPTDERRAPIPIPLDDAEVQYLIRTWEYLQWFHRKD